ncbi:MAG: NAD-dependent epimerase/dehydratase family protein [Patescibacteria group bacterium]
MKVLITGGAGFIGAFVSRALVDRGDTVVLYDDMNSFLYPAELKEVRLSHLFPQQSERPRLVVGNVLDSQLLNTVFTEEKFDTVLHFAALANPARSLESAQEYTLVNVLGTVNVLEAASVHEIPRFIFAGSSSVYNDEQTPFKEDMWPLLPRSPYGASKASAEAFCAMWHELHGLPMTVLRFFSVYGPWGRPDMAPAVFARQILNDEPLYVTEGRKRDLTYIDDVVAGVMAATQRQFAFEIFNIGRGEPQSLHELVAALSRAAHKTPRIEAREAPEGELTITYANIDKAREMLGYNPKVSLAEGAQRLMDWMKTQP